MQIPAFSHALLEVYEAVFYPAVISVTPPEPEIVIPRPAPRRYGCKIKSLPSRTDISGSFWQGDFLTTAWAPAHAAECCFSFQSSSLGRCARCSEKRQRLQFFYLFTGKLYVKARAYVSRGACQHSRPCLSCVLGRSPPGAASRTLPPFSTGPHQNSGVEANIHFLPYSARKTGHGGELTAEIGLQLPIHL